jgi:hypothetical protein
MIEAHVQESSLHFIKGIALALAALFVAAVVRLMPVERSANGFIIFLLIAAMFVPWIIFIFAIVSFVRAFMMYAKAKGYDGRWGLLILLPIVGWIVLIVLPDQRKDYEVPGFPLDHFR